MTRSGSVQVIHYLLQPDVAKPICKRLGHASAASLGEALEMLQVIGYTPAELSAIKAEYLASVEVRLDDNQLLAKIAA